MSCTCPPDPKNETEDCDGCTAESNRLDDAQQAAWDAGRR